MTIEFRCGQCNQLLRVPDNSSGKNARCPKCKALMQIPAASAVPSAAAGAPPPPLPPMPLSAVAPPPLPGQGSGGFPSGGFPSFGTPPAPPPVPPQPASSDDPFSFLKGDAPAKTAPPPPPPTFGPPMAANNPFSDPGGAKSANPFGGVGANPYAASAPAGYYVPQPGAMSGRIGLPWEAKKQSFGSWWETMTLIIGSPSRAFSMMRQQGGLGGPLIYTIIGSGIPVLVVMLFAIPIGLIIAVIAAQEGGAQGGGAVLGVGAVVLVAVLVGAAAGIVILTQILMFIMAGIYHLCLMMVGGARQPYETTFRVACYAQGAMAPLGFLRGLIPYLGGFIHMIWMIVLLIIGIARAHEIPTGKAALAVLLPFGVCFVLWVGFIALMVAGAVAGAN
jgi:phage FluMu protein Com